MSQKKWWNSLLAAAIACGVSSHLRADDTPRNADASEETLLAERGPDRDRDRDHRDSARGRGNDRRHEAPPHRGPGREEHGNQDRHRGPEMHGRFGGPPWMRDRSPNGSQSGGPQFGGRGFGPPFMQGPSPFDRIDGNHDGKISKGELMERFQQADKDGDGFVTRDELIRQIMSGPPRPDRDHGPRDERSEKRDRRAD